ncbi:hypothetical protein N431DRAFT_450124 [Stipitochalara longipes BDJ]|nr:hypothetical protein N431DRAFT_450124 [Stipitochalara longipes BDJ]
MVQLLLAVACFAMAATATICYDTTGTITTGLQACNPSAATTPCCGGPDYCLSNGVCLNAGANNLLGNQGCTDQNWGSPCHKYCAGQTWATNLFPCSNTEIDYNGEISYCCGPSTSCCSNSSLVFSVPVGSVILRPSQLAVYTSTASQTTTTTATASFTSISSSTHPTTFSPQPSPAKSNALALGLGLGVGLPLGLTLIGALLFLAWELRKHNQRGGVQTSSAAYPRLDSAANAQVEVKKAELPT